MPLQLDYSTGKWGIYKENPISPLHLIYYEEERAETQLQFHNLVSEKQGKMERGLTKKH